MNRWRGAFVCRVIGIPALLAGAWVLWLMAQGDVRPSAINLVQFSVVFLLGLFLVMLHRRVDISALGVTIRTRWLFWTRRRVIPAERVRRLEVSASGELHSGQVGADSGGNSSRNYYDMTLYDTHGVALCNLNPQVLFARPDQIADCTRLAREVVRVLGCDLVLGEPVQNDLPGNGVL
ncbi:hypothetical protein F3N42_14850 [Marinihelvus fidelis]|uniref:Uncharacterized protein n=1 Tax=Marinihelvus fidelis TaxID=2613842 RepID=A0A5N0T3J4_9GAMM|nr:hypothetical protein [Marinihelvus fidelis]KAA9129640.1 hypothetical protein F3N42_14850 [Marinihelvus fidelis]